MTAPGGAKPAERPAVQPAAEVVDEAAATPTRSTPPAIPTTTRPQPAPPVRTRPRTRQQPAPAVRTSAQGLAERMSGRIAALRTAVVARARGQLATRATNAVQHTRTAARASAAVSRFSLGRVLCWQLALLAVLAAAHEPHPILGAVVTAAVLVVVATTVRVRGLLLAQWLQRAARFVSRRRHRTAAPDAAGGGVLDLVTRHTRVQTVELDDTPVAFIHQPAGVTAVLELSSSTTMQQKEFSAVLSSPAPLLPPSTVDQPPFAAQLVMQLSPAVPGNRGDTTRRTWITIQAIRTADIYQDADLNAVLANAVRRLIRRLTRDDLPSRALDRDEALSLIAALSQVGDTAEDPPTARETWGAWQTGSTAQACFRIDRWQEASENDRQLALRRLQMVPSRGTTVAIAAQRGDRRVEQPTRMVIRITEATHTRLNNSADLLRFAMRDVAPSIRVERLNGDHLAAVAASLPLGGRAAAR